MVWSTVAFCTLEEYHGLHNKQVRSKFRLDNHRICLFLGKDGEQRSECTKVAMSSFAHVRLALSVRACVRVARLADVRSKFHKNSPTPKITIQSVGGRNSPVEETTFEAFLHFRSNE